MKIGRLKIEFKMDPKKPTDIQIIKGDLQRLASAFNTHTDFFRLKEGTATQMSVKLFQNEKAINELTEVCAEQERKIYKLQEAQSAIVKVLDSLTKK